MAVRSYLFAPQNIRAAAILTNGAVQSSTIGMLNTLTQKLLLWVTFTLGSLTNVLLTPSLSYDGTNFFAASSLGTLGVITLVASGSLVYVVDAPGAKVFRVGAQGTGTVTSSSLQLDVSYQIA